MPDWINRLQSIPGHLKAGIDHATNWDGFWWIGAIAGVLVMGGCLSWVFWEDLRGDQESLSTTIRNLGLVVGGIIAMVLAVWCSTVAERQAETAQQQSDTAQRQVEAVQRQADTAQQGLLNDRYERGAGMLGSDVLPVRLAGIYALERLAVEHPEEYHIQIMDLLCAFVRNPTRDDRVEGHPESDDGLDE